MTRTGKLSRRKAMICLASSAISTGLVPNCWGQGPTIHVKRRRQIRVLGIGLGHGGLVPLWQTRCTYPLGVGA